MEFDQLRTMLAVLEHGSFTRAADALGLSQSTVSFHIKGLEASLGARVLDRGRDGVQPTAQGKILRRYAERLIEMRSEALSRMKAEAQGRAGHVVVAASTIAGEVMLPPVLTRLRRSHPGVSVTIGVSDSGGALAQLVAGHCDLALVGSLPQDRRVVSRPFENDEIVLVAPSPNPFFVAGELGQVDAEGNHDPSLLGRVPMVLRHESSGTRAAVADLLARHCEPGQAARIVVGSSEAAKRCVLAQLGFAFVSRRAVADELAAGRLEIVPLLGLPVKRSFYVARLRGATPSSAAAALIALLGAGDSLPVA
ncbi:MAG: LysR family transcriptional regulator [Nannocystaceae bacterium]|nr:LysR family transcriptional regulator [Nannocystaceae bacterium]